MSQKLEYEKYKLPVVVIGTRKLEGDKCAVFVTVAPAYRREDVMGTMVNSPFALQLACVSGVTADNVEQFSDDILKQIRETCRNFALYNENPNDPKFSNPYYQSKHFLSLITIMQPYVQLSGCREKFWEMMEQKAVDQFKFTIQPNVCVG